MSLFKMPLARLELAPRVDPDWILSPTRLPIPPQGLVQNLELLNDIINKKISQYFFIMVMNQKRNQETNSIQQRLPISV